MEKMTLAVMVRSSDEKASHLRQKNLIPGVVYGHGFENIHVKVDYQTFRRVFEQATYSTLVGLDVEGKDVPVLVHDVQYDPVTDNIIHIDFHAVRMDEKVTTHIALEFIGVSEAVKKGAVLNTVKHEVEVSALPGDLVHTISVDISSLNEIGDIIRIADITPPKGVEILANPEEPVVSAVELRVVEDSAAEASAEGASGEGAEKTEAGEKKEE